MSQEHTTGPTGLGGLLDKVMPVVLFIVALFLLPSLFSLVHRIPSLYLYFEDGRIGISFDDPSRDYGYGNGYYDNGYGWGSPDIMVLDLRIIAALVLFLMPIFFFIMVADRFVSRI